VVDQELLQLSANKQKVDEIMRHDRRITFREIAAQLGVGRHAVQEMREILE
jgi:phage antirepressor YoqD-like protein